MILIETILNMEDIYVLLFKSSKPEATSSKMKYSGHSLVNLL